MQNNQNITMNTKSITNITLGTWNLCLGLRNKKDYVSKMINEHKVDIMCLQEIDIEANYPHNILSFKGYNFLTENNSIKARAGMYINNTITYQRRSDLEKMDCGIIIVDVNLPEEYRIICLYRVFSPNNQTTQYDYFKNQMEIIANSCNDASKKSIILGDFNLDENKKNCSQYSHSRYYDLLQNNFNELNLIQLIKFNTWSRLVGTDWKESCLDHIYTNDASLISNIYSVSPLMGDHKIIIANLGGIKPKPKTSERRSWKNYSKAGLLEMMKNVKFDLEISSVQELCNEIENKIINVVDKIAPISKFCNNQLEDSSIRPEWLKRKINLRKKLLKKLKGDKTQSTKSRVKNLSAEIKQHFTNEKKYKVRQGIKPGNSKTLWEAVKIAKDLNTDELPDKMNQNGTPIDNDELAEQFAAMFEKRLLT